MEGHVCLACIAESKTRSEQKRVIQSDQDVQVFGLFLVIWGWTLLHDSLSFVISNTGYQIFFLTCLCKHVAYLLWVCIFSLFSFFFYWHTPWACGLPSLGRHLLFSFCIAQVVLESKVIEFLFLWMHVATISQCGSIVCVHDLDQESMTSF